MSKDTFSPENDADTLYIYTGICDGGQTMNFEELIERIKFHFGEEISLSSLDITSERMHTRSIYYDLYDPFDYDCYITITRKK